MSFLGSSPAVARPSRRLCESDLSESAGIAEKLMVFDFIFSFFSTRSPRAGRLFLRSDRNRYVFFGAFLRFYACAISVGDFCFAAMCAAELVRKMS
jgi:hypothetical protein